MINLVSLARFNELRFAQDPIPNAKLWRWCREGKVPARKIGGEWFIDLDAFDRGGKEPEKQGSTPSGVYPPDTPRMVVNLLAARASR